MARYTQDSIERVREAADIVEVIGARTDLRRVGTRYTGLCPFHDEKTPSFSVDAEKGFYYCFGCQQGGDTIGFVQETEGVDFPDAVELLAERYNVELKREREDPHEEEMRRRRERMLRCSSAPRASTSAISPNRRRRREHATTWPSAGSGRRC